MYIYNGVYNYNVSTGMYTGSYWYLAVWIAVKRCQALAFMLLTEGVLAITFGLVVVVVNGKYLHIINIVIRK